MPADRIAIIGAREHPNPEVLRPLIDSFPRGTTVISGGAKGIDSAAREIALVNELAVLEYVIVDPDLPTAGVIAKHWSAGLDRAPLTKRIGIRPHASARDLLIFRNTWIAISCDRAYAFTQGSRGGTTDAIEQMRRFLRPCEIRW